MSEHTHPHTHEHHDGAANKEEIVALLGYMIDHNKHHADEIHEMAHGVSGEAAELLHDAVGLFADGTKKLEAALAILKGE